jgi:hypothetical protein
MARTKERARDTRPAARNDAYTTMLAITLLAILVGCVLMYLDYDEYGKQSAPAEKAPALPRLGEGTTAPKGTTPGGGGSGDTGMGRLTWPTAGPAAG